MRGIVCGCFFPSNIETRGGIKVGLTVYFSCPLGSCDAAPCKSPQTRDLCARAQPCPPFSGLHRGVLTPDGNICRNPERLKCQQTTNQGSTGKIKHSCTVSVNNQQ